MPAAEGTMEEPDDDEKPDDAELQPVIAAGSNGAGLEPSGQPPAVTPPLGGSEPASGFFAPSNGVVAVPQEAHT